MTDSVLLQIAALKTTPTPVLKERWRKLFASEPPPYNRRFLESRLAYRIQELAYGGLKPTTVARLDALAEQLVSGKGIIKPRKAMDRPVVGTRLIREWQGVPHEVIVRIDGYAYQGRPYKSLSAVAKAITGTQWNGPVFFGLRTGKRRP
jgi:hypothetical protein